MRKSGYTRRLLSVWGLLTIKPVVFWFSSFETYAEKKQNDEGNGPCSCIPAVGVNMH